MVYYACPLFCPLHVPAIWRHKLVELLQSVTHNRRQEVLVFYSISKDVNTGKIIDIIRNITKDLPLYAFTDNLQPSIHLVILGRCPEINAHYPCDKGNPLWPKIPGCIYFPSLPLMRVLLVGVTRFNPSLLDIGRQQVQRGGWNSAVE